MTSWVRWAILGATALGVVILFLVLSPGESPDGDPPPQSSPSPSPADGSPTVSPSPTPPEPTSIEVTVQGEQIRGPGRPAASQGDQVLIVVRADVSDHVHVHGYDLMADVAPGAPARIRFRANVSGIFEVELEDAGRPLFQLEISP